MKSADRKLTYSVVVILAVIAAEIAWLLFVGPSYHNPYYTAECKSDCDIPFWAAPEFWTALFTAILTGSTVLLWWVTRNSWLHAQESSERQLRAYIFVTSCARQGPHQSVMTFAISVKNTGQTPAYAVVLRTGGIYIPEGSSIEPSIKDRGIHILGPGEAFTFRHQTDEPSLSAKEILAIKEGRARYLIRIEILYRDAFNEPRTTKFGISYSKNSVVNGLLNIETGAYAN